MTQTTKTISFTDELDKDLDEAVENLSKQQIKGHISKSKIIRIAVAEYLEKLSALNDINNKFKKINIQKLQKNE